MAVDQCLRTWWTLSGMEIAQTISKTLPHPRYRLPFAGDIIGLDTAKPVQKEMAMATELGGSTNARFSATDSWWSPNRSLSRK